MILSQLSATAVKQQLKSSGLKLQIGPFTYRLISANESVTEGVIALYGDYSIVPADGFIDFTVTICRGKGMHRWTRRQAIFEFDGSAVFVPLPENHAFPLLEWSMNWCVSMYAHHYLILHSAVIERDGFAAILPAPPGSGKSTLCAGLIHRGWRLLSDELALISLTDTLITPFGRPISLKNQSIDIIRKFVPSAVFSRVVHDTSKGSVSLLKVPSAHIERINEPGKPRWIIFPKYVAGSKAQLTKRSKASSMLELGRNSFNYMVLGLKGFEVLSRVVDASDCYDFQYSQLDDAVAVFDDLAAQAQRSRG